MPSLQIRDLTGALASSCCRRGHAKHKRSLSQKQALAGHLRLLKRLATRVKRRQQALERIRTAWRQRSPCSVRTAGALIRAIENADGIRLLCSMLSAALRVIHCDPSAAAWAESLQRALWLLLAPELMLSEGGNTLGMHSCRQPERPIPSCFADARDLVDQIEPRPPFAGEALALACHLNHPVYELPLFALARREAATLLTADGGYRASRSGLP